MNRKIKIELGVISLILFLCVMPVFLSFSEKPLKYINGLQLASNPNIELISESEFITKWDITNGTAGYNAIYNETFETGSDNWSLYNVQEHYFEKTQAESGNYLLENYTLSDNILYTGTHFNVSNECIFPHGLTWDGTYFWIVDSGTDEAYKYTASGIYTGTYFDVTNEDYIPQGITWDGTYLWIIGSATDTAYKYTTSGTYTGTSFSVGTEDGSPSDIVWDGMYFWVVGTETHEVYKYTASGTYTGTHFDIYDETIYSQGIAWDGVYLWVTDRYPYNANAYKYTTSGTYTGIYFDVSNEETSPEAIAWDGNYFWIVGVENKEMYRYTQKYHISKNYQGNSILYCQTNTTETLTLRSPDTLDLTLQEGDKIEITFNTSSTNRIDLNLYNNTVKKKSYILSSQGNGDFSTHTKTFTINSNMSIDQLEFTGTFSDTKNLIVDSILIERGYGETYTYYLAPYERRELDLGYPHNYTIEVYENDELMEEWAITTSTTVQSLIYYRIDSEIVYLTYYDSNNEYLDFNLFTTYINYTLDDFTYTNERLSSHILYVDKDSLIEFQIYDSFNALIKECNNYEETFIDLTLDVYTLKIKNEALEFVNYTLKNTNTEIEKAGNIFPEEITKFHIASGVYTLDYINHEDMYPRNLEFEFTTNKLITINSTYHQIYFSLFTYDGLGIDPNLVRFYINGERSNFGFNAIQTEATNLLVLDFFNNTLVNKTIDASAYSEYNLFVEIYTMTIINDFEFEDIICNITQVNSNIWMSQTIPKGLGLNYRFLPNVQYNITVYYENNTLYETKIVNLTSNNHIESFGTLIGTPEYPKDVYFSIYNYDGLGLDFNLFKFYLDENRTDFGFSYIENMIIHVQVKDFFDYSLFDQYINTSGIYEYNIQVTVYTAILVNNFNRTIQIEIERGNSTDTFILGSRSGLEIQLLPNAEYTFTAYENDGEYIEEKEVELEEDYMVIDFGFYSEKVPKIPQPIQIDYNNLALTVCFIAGVLVIPVIIHVAKAKKKTRYY